MNLYRTPITVHERLSEVNGVAQWRNTPLYAYVDPDTQGVTLTDAGIQPSAGLFMAVRTDGFPSLWSVKQNDEVTVNGNRRVVTGVTPVTSPTGSIRHVEVVCE